jgi:hypothetical protein
MESYVVRIYRRNSSSPQNLVGLVELVDADEERIFKSFEELRAILSCKQVSVTTVSKDRNPETDE